MSAEYNAVQESIKIALDAADAATDVTSEFNKVKRDNKKLEASVKNVHRYTVIIFASSMVAAVAALVFAGLIYFRTMADLSTMTTTSREALVVFAENVDSVNDSLSQLRAGLDTQRQLVAQNEALLSELGNLREVIGRTNEAVIAGLQETSSTISTSNETLANAITTGIAGELGSQTRKMIAQMEATEVKTEAVITGMKEEFSDADFVAGLATNQKNMMSQINTLSAQTAAMLEMFKERDNRVSYP
jgi:hypothetical protein